MIWHLSQIFFTLGWTFTVVLSCSAACPVSRTPWRSLVAVDDAPTGEVVGRKLHNDPVLGQDADVVLTHLATDVCEDLVAVFQLDAEHRVGKRLDHATL